MKTKIAINKSDLASRRTASVERKALEEAILFGDRVEVDLSCVNSISESYSDELFGVLVAKHGLEAFIKQVTILNAKESILKSIAKVIQRREFERKKSFEISEAIAMA
ncbi:STAS-like domain-containing protein [Vibrio parahaemolyticus]